jgi:autophagy-related protein 17
VRLQHGCHIWLNVVLVFVSSEENQVRKCFNAEHGAHLPEDICLCIGNPPTKWTVEPSNEDTPDVLPDIENDLIAEVRLLCNRCVPSVE